MIKLISAILLLLTSAANAAEVAVSWKPPAARMDGTPLSSADIASYNVFIDGELSGRVSGTATTTTAQIKGSGEHCIALQTVDSGGLMSGKSAPKCFNLMSAPKAPTNISVSMEPGGINIVISQ